MSEWYVDEYEPGGYVRELGSPSKAAIVWCHDLEAARQIVSDHNHRSELAARVETLTALLAEARGGLQSALDNLDGYDPYEDGGSWAKAIAEEIDAVLHATAYVPHAALASPPAAPRADVVEGE